MLSYTLAQAQELLTGKLSSAQQNFSNVVEDLEFLREQITIMEVNTARVNKNTGAISNRCLTKNCFVQVYNWDVRRRRLKREAEAAGKAIAT